jgi:hypothetical protein
VHHVPPLAVVTRDPGGWTRVSDCRRVVPSLGELVSIDLIGGDGQEAGPGGALPEPVRFAVRNGGLPVAGARIKVTAHAGKVTDGTADDTEIVTATGTDGVAAVRWTLETGSGAAQAQTLVAQRIDDHDQPADVEVIVSARLSAPEGGRPPGLHVIKAILNTADAGDFTNDREISPDQLAGGITVMLDGPLRPESVSIPETISSPSRTKPVVRVVLDLPWPLPREVAAVWPDLRPVGFRPIELDAVTSADADKHVITWMPSDNTREWLVDQLQHGLQQAGWDRPLVGRFVIDGWGIVGAESETLHLNGHGNTFVDAHGQTQLHLPTDDEVTGGQFVQWFRLGL